MGAIDIEVPPVGPDVRLTLVRWYVNDGAAVRAGTSICELETEKASADLETPFAGVIWHVAAAGDSLGGGQVIGRVSPIETEA